jgi:hypothetical protein
MEGEHLNQWTISKEIALEIGIISLKDLSKRKAAMCTL